MTHLSIQWLLPILFFSPLLWGQQTQGFKIPDSLKNKTYLELGLSYMKTRMSKDTMKAYIYANSYLQKSKNDKDTIKIAEGYDLLSLIIEENMALNYMDSIINITKNINNFQYPSTAYLYRGNYFYKKRAFKKALDNLINANKYARKNHNSELIYRSNYVIGILKNRIGNHKEALEIHRECFNHVKKDMGKNIGNGDYLNTTFSLVTAFYRLQKIDSAAYYNNLGIERALKIENNTMYNYFVLSSGVVSHLQQNNTAALDSIHKSLPYLEEIDDKPNRAVAYYYLGKIYYETDFKAKGIYYLKKLDTIFQQQKDILPETRHGYEILINHYKKNKDQKNQLRYIEKLLEVDSVLYSYYRYIQKNVAQHYDTPLLLEEKDEIIHTLEKEKQYSYMGIIASASISLLAVIFWVLNYQKRKSYKKRFEALLHTTDKEKNVEKKQLAKENASIGISEDIVHHILTSLDKFEEKEQYLKPNITTSSLSKRFHTNSKYLSKVINFYKKKSFSIYINELRINYVVEKLQTDKRLRNYTINAIARETGFNTTEAFSKSFLKKTGIYPSYFIKELEKQ